MLNIKYLIELDFLFAYVCFYRIWLFISAFIMCSHNIQFILMFIHTIPNMINIDVTPWCAISMFPFHQHHQPPVPWGRRATGGFPDQGDLDPALSHWFNRCSWIWYVYIYNISIYIYIYWYYIDYTDLLGYDITMNYRDLAIQMEPTGKPQTMGI